jgi:histidinol dehydrogenase
MSKGVIPLAQTGTSKAAGILKNILQARTIRDKEVQPAVEVVLQDIREKGDSALFKYTLTFDKRTVSAKNVRISKEHIISQAEKTPPALRKTIREAAKRIRTYHKHQKIKVDFSIKTPEGRLGQITHPLNRAGVYIPGGYTSYPSTVLMNAIPAQIAGVKEIVAVTPPRGELDPSIAFVLKLLKVEEVYQVGGAQAIGALAYGTRSIPAVDKIVGPGNSYVAMAKKLVYGTVDIDCVAGPSEVVILADTSVDPSWVALDLLSQAEHGSGDEIAICISENKKFAEKIQRCITKEISNSSVKDTFKKLPSYAISLFTTKSRKESIEFINTLAPEHLQIMTKTCRQDVQKIKNASAIFLGPHTPVALGDYFIGTNHVLPTGSAARYASPLGVYSFLKRMSVAEVSLKGIKECMPHVSRFARAEQFVHHALSVEKRLEKE